MAKKKIEPVKTDWLNRLLTIQPIARRRAFFSLVAVGLLALTYLLYTVTFLGQIYPNVAIGGVEFGGLTRSQAREKLATALQDDPPSPITLVRDENRYELTSESVTWQVNNDQTVEDLYNVGRSSGNFWRSLGQQLKAPFTRQQRQLVANYDTDLLNAAIASVAEGVDRPAKDATANFVNGDLAIEREEVGHRINQKEVHDQVITMWGTFSRGEVELKTEFEAPKVVIADEAQLRAQAEVLLESQLSLSWEGGTRKLSKKDMSELIGFVGRAPETPITDEGENQQILTAQFTPSEVKGFLNTIAADIDKPAVDPKLVIRNGVLTVAEASKKGLVVDIETSSTAVMKVLLDSSLPRQAALALKIQDPVVDENNLDALGIKEVIGRGETSFVGSPANRIHNIKTGLSFLQSALLKPGEEFSTVKKLGAVDNTTGYLPELVIKENRTTPEYGGGLCQVSTTLFRSVLKAGLKVTERQNHSYRVSYYEPPVGLDATIYLPRPDFKFLNDTPGHILVQGQVIGNRIIFELWGTSDGRTAVVTDPIITNIKPPPPEIRTDTDTLPLGEVKQIEKPHEGATAIAYYTVTRNGQVINKQTFKSVYKPWAARFLVGTRVDNPPPPEGQP